jgi:hypothetical protein
MLNSNALSKVSRGSKMTFGKRATAFLAVMMTCAACAWQNYDTLDVRTTDIAPIQTIAIATISARPSLAQPVFNGNRGELVNVLGKFETELTNALTNRGFNVVNVSQSGLIYNSANLEYEIGYLHNTDDFMAKARGEDHVHAEARRLRAHSAALVGSRTDQGTFLNPRDTVDQITSPNTRIFPEIGVNYRFNLPRYTENGGALDNRFMSDASRLSIGEISRDMGADAYILIDANVLLSARKEGFILAGLTGGTRYVTVDGTAALVRNDGVILNVDWLRSQSVIPVGGTNQGHFTTERVTGLSGFHTSPDQYGLLEGAYQAIRISALDIANRYAGYRDDVIKKFQHMKNQ